MKISSVIAKFKSIRKYIIVFLAGIVFSIISFHVINIAAKHSSTPEYCAGSCHEMETAYKTWELSSHYANRHGVKIVCIDCHLPPKEKFFTHLAAKAYAGAKDVYLHHFGEEYDIEKIREKVLEEMPNSRCLRCHSNLLVKPSSSSARGAHQIVLNPEEGEELRCVECHDNLHQRENNIFSDE